MRIIGRLGRVLFGWLNLGVNSLESKNVDALIASLEDEKSKAEQETYERLVAVKTTVIKGLFLIPMILELNRLS